MLCYDEYRTCGGPVRIAGWTSALHFAAVLRPISPTPSAARPSLHRTQAGSDFCSLGGRAQAGARKGLLFTFERFPVAFRRVTSPGRNRRRAFLLSRACFPSLLHRPDTWPTLAPSRRLRALSRSNSRPQHPRRLQPRDACLSRRRSLLQSPLLFQPLLNTHRSSNECPERTSASPARPKLQMRSLARSLGSLGAP